MDKYTLITGASEGLGLEFAKIYASRGENLVLISRNLEKLSKVKLDLIAYKVNIEVLSLDLSLESSWIKVIEFIEKKNIVVDRLINNAGIGCFGCFDKYPIELINDIIDLNIKALTNLTYLFLNKMIQNDHGEILNIASTAAFSAGPRMSVYYATKSYVLSLTESLNEEYSDKNIKISCLCPGAIKTRFQDKSGIEKRPSAEKLLMNPSDVAIQGVKGLDSGKAIIIPGFKNKLIVILNKFMPRYVSRKVVLKMNLK